MAQNISPSGAPLPEPQRTGSKKVKPRRASGKKIETVLTASFLTATIFILGGFGIAIITIIAVAVCGSFTDTGP